METVARARQTGRRILLGSLSCALLLLTHAASLEAAEPDSSGTDALKRLSLEELLDVQVTSVSKTEERLSDAPAAIYVITHDDIARSGATSLPEMLRLAPNLQVARTGSSTYVITARGFSGNAENQNLPNKLLVLIDGRSVYTPLFSGVYWDMQQVMAEDIDRIEVISGPGATLWGANAMNGVINIITRKSADTQGEVVRVSGGNMEKSASARFGGHLNSDAAIRVYAEGFDRDALESSGGVSADDAWTHEQAGFRFDWTRSAADSLTMQGDIYRVSEDQPGAAGQAIDGYNLLVRAGRDLAQGSRLELQAYYDQTERRTKDASGSGFVFRTYDVQLQHSFALGDRNAIVWGIGDRLNRYSITNTPVFLFSPAQGTSHLANVFAQDSISLAKAVKLTLGLKFEADPYSSGMTPLPSARLSWNLGDKALLWSAVSRAVRSPTPFDRDVIEKVGALVFLTGGANYSSEKVTAYEVGYRGQPTARTSLSVSTFYQVYDDLRSVEFTPVTFLPLQWGNGMKGNTYGVEVWGSYQALDWWRLAAGFNTLHENLAFKAGSAGSLGLAGFPGIEQAGSDPARQASLRSSMDLRANVRFDADLRYVGARPDPVTPGYTELNVSAGWKPSKPLEISLTGFNLLHARHVEYAATPTSIEVGRSVWIEAHWRH